MTFRDDADIGSGRTSKRGKMALGGGLGLVAVVLIAQLLGVDVTGFLGGSGGAPAEGQSLEHCQTGADANADIECRMVGASASLEAYWEDADEAIGVRYEPPAGGLVLFDQAVQTGCGSGSSATGPFYCPLDETIYIDVSFFGALQDRFGAEGGPLAEMYVVAHEWGHHMQHLTGVLEETRDRETGPTSNAVRVELQADCFAGAWAAAASTVTDDSGTPFLQPLTDAQIRDALSAAAAVGDDRIQETTQGEVDPHAFTHGTSEQRQDWFLAGFRGGADSCDTFSVAGSEL
ncbi:MAG TPA: neutral zinc metallopeptidase [Acidimicrobiia bacterium]|nr:neutral zinc metallopeptidase [Acidimicrobiia bacterium]